MVRIQNWILLTIPVMSHRSDIQRLAKVLLSAFKPIDIDSPGEIWSAIAGELELMMGTLPANEAAQLKSEVQMSIFESSGDSNLSEALGNSNNGQT